MHRSCHPCAIHLYKILKLSLMFTGSESTLFRFNPFIINILALPHFAQWQDRIHTLERVPFEPPNNEPTFSYVFEHIGQIKIGPYFTGWRVQKEF